MLHRVVKHAGGSNSPLSKLLSTDLTTQRNAVGASDFSFSSIQYIHTYIRDIAKSNGANHHVNRLSKIPNPSIRYKQANQQNKKEII
jgi:hypothetical protein